MQFQSLRLLSEWRSSLKGMETVSNFVSGSIQFIAVRMEVFPERDGNAGDEIRNVSVGIHESEWRSSLKGMETW